MKETYVIHITKKCNLDCLYCYEQDKESVYSFDEIKTYIDDIFKDIKNNIVHIEFLGGEPLSEFELLEKVYYYLENTYCENISDYTITTNGTFANDDIINFLIKNKNITIAISMDGTKYANQLRVFKNGKNSYDSIAENIKKLQKNNILPAIHIVTHPYNIGFMFDSIKHIYNDLNISNIGIGTVESTMQIDEEYCNEFKKQIKLVSDFITKNNLPISIDLFKYIKPISDIRTYVEDKITKKVIFESYGRIENSIFNSNKYEIRKCSEKNSINDMINNIRIYAYNYHNSKENNMSLLDNNKNNGLTVCDCVGKVGDCAIVSNPIDNKLYKNLFIQDINSFNDLISNEEGFINKNSIELKLATDEIEEKISNKDISRDELVASALIEILSRLERIENKLRS